MKIVNAFLQDAYRFTLEGLDKYWSSIDSAIHHWDIIVSAKFLDKKKNFTGKVQHSYCDTTMINSTWITEIIAEVLVHPGRSTTPVTDENYPHLLITDWI